MKAEKSIRPTETFFARHTEKLGVDDQTRKALWEGCRIAIHYPDYADSEARREDNTSLRLEDYLPEDRRVIGTLLDLAKGGGYVCAEHFNQDNIQLGWVDPESTVKVFDGTWAPTSEYPGRKAKLKSLQLSKVKILNPSEAAVVLVGRPRMGTLQRWHACKSRISDLVDGISRPLTLDDLLDYEQETMCAEFLRTQDAEKLGLPRLTNLMVPVGRTMKDIDIVGIGDNEKMIIGQVTYHDLSKSKSKIEAIRKYSRGNHLVFFCRVHDHFMDGVVHIVSIQKVFDVFSSTPTGKKWLALLRGAV